ncbi:MAG: hypothetical protein IPH65_12265 [Dehalococcoidia bacterium]|nr:hypothetical protein [Dehalococcoidia bacterium]
MSSPLNVPEPVARVAALMSAYPFPWALCGGWAVDSWLGRVTREHADLDIAVFESDQRALLEHLAEWNLIAHDEDEPQAIEPWTGRTLVLPAHLHAREPGLENAALVRQWVTPPYTQAKDGRDFRIHRQPGRGRRMGLLWRSAHRPPRRRLRPRILLGASRARPGGHRVLQGHGLLRPPEALGAPARCLRLRGAGAVAGQRPARMAATLHRDLAPGAPVATQPLKPHIRGASGRARSCRHRHSVRVSFRAK